MLRVASPLGGRSAHRIRRSALAALADRTGISTDDRGSSNATDEWTTARRQFVSVHNHAHVQKQKRLYRNVVLHNAIPIHEHIVHSSMQRRHMSSWLPEAFQQISIWGGTGHLLKAIHMDGTVPYWACFALINAGLRTALLPLVVYSARTSARFAKVSPEIQFIITLFQNDLKKLREQKKSLLEQRFLFTQNLETIRSIYKLHKINPLTVFLSPLLQIPFFYYVAVDLRKIVNGADPALAQALTESSFWWLTDLTDPDPWYGLPMAAGAMLYFNVEVALGRRSLSGPAASKSDFAGLLKDAFQTLAVFMPCFASQSPAGLQIYLLSSFTFTLFQSAALRTDALRERIGLPAMGTPPEEPKYAKQFMEFKKMEQKAREIRGDGPVLGKGILAHGFETSFPGSNRPSTIQGSDESVLKMLREAEAEQKAEDAPTMQVAPKTMLGGGPFIHGISAPPDQIDEQVAAAFAEKDNEEAMVPSTATTTTAATTTTNYMDQPTEDEMEAANKGIRMAPVEVDAITPTNATKKSINVKKFRSKRGGKRRR